MTFSVELVCDACGEVGYADNGHYLLDAHRILNELKPAGWYRDEEKMVDLCPECVSSRENNAPRCPRTR